MIIREERQRPASWTQYKQSIRNPWSKPWHVIELVFQWIAYFLSRWAFLAVLEYVGMFSVLFGVIFYYSELWRPKEAEALSGLASYQHRAGKRWQRGENRSSSGTERRQNSAGRSRCRRRIPPGHSTPARQLAPQ